MTKDNSILRWSLVKQMVSQQEQLIQRSNEWQPKLIKDRGIYQARLVYIQPLASLTKQ